jgi:hypothetical protein
MCGQEEESTIRGKKAYWYKKRQNAARVATACSKEGRIQKKCVISTKNSAPPLLNMLQQHPSNYTVSHTHTHTHTHTHNTLTRTHILTAQCRLQQAAQFSIVLIKERIA